MLALRICVWPIRWGWYWLQGLSTHPYPAGLRSGPRHRECPRSGQEHGVGAGGDEGVRPGDEVTLLQHPRFPYFGVNASEWGYRAQNALIALFPVRCGRDFPNQALPSACAWSLAGGPSAGSMCGANDPRSAWSVRRVHERSFYRRPPTFWAHLVTDFCCITPAHSITVLNSKIQNVEKMPQYEAVKLFFMNKPWLYSTK